MTMSILICCLYILVWYIEFNYYDFLIDRLLISSDELLFGATFLPLILVFLITIIPFLIHDAKILIPGQKIVIIEGVSFLANMMIQTYLLDSFAI
jgi:hypothetical protein